MRLSSPRNDACVLSSGTAARSGVIEATRSSRPLAVSRSLTVLRYWTVVSLLSGVTPGAGVPSGHVPNRVGSGVGEVVVAPPLFVPPALLDVPPVPPVVLGAPALAMVPLPPALRPAPLVPPTPPVVLFVVAPEPASVLAVSVMLPVQASSSCRQNNQRIFSGCSVVACSVEPVRARVREHGTVEGSGMT